MNTLQAQTAYVGGTEIKQVRLGNELVLAPNGDILWYKANELPSLDLRFADNKSLVDATTGQNLVTFTRASSGTYVDSQGVIQRATTNLLLRSEEFDSASWVPTNAIVTANQTIAPNGTLTADQFVENVAGSARLAQNIAATPGVFYTASIYLKAGTNSIINWREDAEDVYGVAVNLATGTITGGSGTIVPVGNNWYRVSFTGSVSGTTFKPEIRAVNSPGTIFIWGAQLEQSSTVGEYIPTTSTINSAPRFDHNPTTGESLGLLVEESRTNLLLRSEEFGTTWTATRSSITADAATAPNNTLTADKLVEDTTATNSHQLQQSATIVANTTYTVSCFIKAAERSELRFLFAAGGDGINALFNLGTGIATAQANTGSGSIVSASLTPVGNGWFRAVCTGIVSPTSTAATLTMRLISSGANSYTGDGTSGLFIWGAQLEAGAFPTSYIPTTTATVTRSADVASITGSNFSSWYRQDEGTVFAHVIMSSSQPKDFSNVFEIEKSDNTDRLFVRYPSFVGWEAAGQSGLFMTRAFTQQSTIALSYKTDSSALAVNASLVEDTSVIIGTTKDQLWIGSSGSGTNLINGNIKRLTYFPARLANETLQQITQ